MIIWSSELKILGGLVLGKHVNGMWWVWKEAVVDSVAERSETGKTAPATLAIDPLFIAMELRHKGSSVLITGGNKRPLFSPSLVCACATWRIFHMKPESPRWSVRLISGFDHLYFDVTSPNIVDFIGILSSTRLVSALWGNYFRVMKFMPHLARRAADTAGMCHC